MSQSYVVILERGEFERRVIGPYRSFKRASDDAKARDKCDGWTTTVEPLIAVWKAEVQGL